MDSSYAAMARAGGGVWQSWGRSMTMRRPHFEHRAIVAVGFFVMSH